MDRKQIIITTSWDDGHVLDIRLANLLEKYGIKGTFYIPISNPENLVMEDNVLVEISKQFEIGGHTVNHAFLNSLGFDDAKYEISTCKTMLENKIGKNVEAFCYPGGKYSARDIKLVNEAGFLFGRTTKLLHTSLNSSDKLMHTSLQAYNHSSFILNYHCLKNRFILPILQNRFFYKENKNFPLLAESLISRLNETGGIFHLWGHSWEIERYGLWNQLEMVLKSIANYPDVNYLNNTDSWRLLK